MTLPTLSLICVKTKPKCELSWLTQFVINLDSNEPITHKREN